MTVELGSLKELVQEVLSELPTPYGVHIIDEVFFAIQTNRDWHGRYTQLCESGSQATVNTWGGRIIGDLLGKRGQHSVKAEKSTLIKTYSLLDTDAKTLARKPNAEEAAHLRWEYWKKNKLSYPADLTAQLTQETALIDSLIIDGETAEDAFRTVVASLRLSDAF